MPSDNDRLTDAEQCALLAVWRLGDDAYGANIRDEIGHHTGRRLSISAVYVTLVRLDKRGLVQSQLAAPTAVRGGKGKRHFRILPAGVEALKRARATLDGLWEGLEATTEWKRG